MEGIIMIGMQYQYPICKNTHFRLTAWKILEESKKVDSFAGTKKGIVREIHEYILLLYKDYTKGMNRTDIETYIRERIFRDFRE